MLYADEACIACRTAKGLARLMAIVVEVCGAFGLTVLEEETEVMYMSGPHSDVSRVDITDFVQNYVQTTSFTYIGGPVLERSENAVEINWRAQLAWQRFKRYTTELYD